MKYNYTRAQYADGSTAIKMYTDIWEPYADVSVNLSAYGEQPKDENHIFIPAYRFDMDILDIIADDIAEEIIEEIDIGDFDRPCIVRHVRLKENWREWRKDSDVW